MRDALIGTMSTPDGPFTVLQDETGAVLASGWTADPARILARLGEEHRPARVLLGQATACEAVEAYYAGQPEPVSLVPIVQFGTVLSHKGWGQLRLIPAGEVRTYTQLAEAMGRPRASRVAASICARNAPALFVPCHRILRSDGALGGFAWGLEIKRALLQREAGWLACESLPSASH